MQPDGTLNPSAEPVELPDPSDSDASYWLARTVWALGEGYAAFKRRRPRVRALPRATARPRPSTRSTGRCSTPTASYLDIDGRRTPAWLIADGADASAEAVLGLAAYVRAGGTAEARRVLTQLSRRHRRARPAATPGSWPFGGVLPWALSRSDWHAWASQMPAALARAADVTR